MLTTVIRHHSWQLLVVAPVVIVMVMVVAELVLRTELQAIM